MFSVLLDYSKIFLGVKVGNFSWLNFFYVITNMSLTQVREVSPPRHGTTWFPYPLNWIWITKIVWVILGCLSEIKLEKKNHPD